MSLSEMLLADSAGSAADWVNRSKKMEVIRAARQEREARRGEHQVQGAVLCVQWCTHPQTLSASNNNYTDRTSVSTTPTSASLARVN